jgi:predicted transcriptional regulator
MMVSRFSILFGMSTTTIKVDSVTRDRLAYLARARGTTMSALLSDVAERLETEQRWCDIEAAYERMQREDPDRWVEYLGELAECEVNTATTDTAAAQEWPEYNQ